MLYSDMLRCRIARFAAVAASLAVAGTLLFSAGAAVGQTRDAKVLTDREKLDDDDSWIYDDLEVAREVARKQSQPLLVVLRCIP